MNAEIYDQLTRLTEKTWKKVFRRYSITGARGNTRKGIFFLVIILFLTCIPQLNTAVGGTTKLEVHAEIYPSVVNPGEAATLTVTVSEIGDDDAINVVVTPVVTSHSNIIISPPSISISKIPEGNQRTFEFKILVPENEPIGSKSIQINVEFTDPGILRDKKESVIKYAGFTVRESTSTSTGGFQWIILFGIFGLILGVGLYLKRNRNINKKSDGHNYKQEITPIDTRDIFPSKLADFYTEVEYIGKGGFARVFKAKRKKDGKIVAVKIPINPDPATGKFFLREIGNWVKLRHPNIVRLYDYNIFPVPYLEMEFCESSLEKLSKPTDVNDAALLIFNVAEGLKYAHSKGIIHRDLKPSNILLKSGVPKISDWGLSKVVTETHPTPTTSFTPLYAAPEQFNKAKFGKTDKRTDIWQLGVVFYELVTGRVPFESDNYYELMAMILNNDPIPPAQLNPEAKDVEPIIMRMLAKRKEERYQSVEELQHDLAAYIGIELKNELNKSQGIGDRKKIIYYLGSLLLLSMKTGNLSDAYKYANDFTKMTSGELKAQFEELRDQIKLRMEEGLELPVELIEKAEILVHETRVT
ncbi:protein kinase domain-containing protein [Thermococcus sp.]